MQGSRIIGSRALAVVAVVLSALGPFGLGSIAGCASFSGSVEELEDAGPGGEQPGSDSGAGPGSPDSGSASGSGGVTCAAHQRSTATGCVCAPGFGDQGGTCTWTGVLRDPEFVGDPAEAWTLVGGTLVPTEGGRVDFGTRGSVAQDVELPTVAEVGGALSLHTTITSTGPGPGPQEISFRGAELQSLLSPSLQLSTCLGEGVMGKALRMQALAAVGAPPIRPWSIQQIVIAPDPACPLPGQVPNGDFEATGGWSTLARPGASYEIAPSLGVSGTIGARIDSTQSCSAALQNLVSIPSAPTALEYAAKGGNGVDAPYTIALGLRQERLVATTLFRNQHTCVPRALLGQTVTLSFEANAACQMPFGLFVDDVKLVSDPACDAQPAVRGGDFEAPDSLTTWVQGSGTGTMTRTGSASTGFGLALARTFECDAASAETVVDVPVPSAGKGLALRFDATSPTGPTEVVVTVGSSLNASTFTFGPDGMSAPPPRQVCLHPASYGGVVPLSLRHSRTGSSTCTTVDITRVTFDNFRVEEDPACFVP